MAKLRAGIIGLGKTGIKQLHALSLMHDVEIAAITTSDPEKWKKLSERYEISSCYSDYRDMLRTADLDVVHDCTPNYLHYEIDKAIINEGKHILSEKPLALFPSEAKELVSLARQKNVKTAVNFIYRHFPVIEQIRKYILDGKLGRIFSIHGAYLQDWLLENTDYDWRVESKFSGQSRALADIGSHWFDIAQFLIMSQITEIAADFATFIPERIEQKHGLSVAVDTEDYAGILFRMENGIHGTVTVCQTCAGKHEGLSFEINGSEASMRWSYSDPFHAVLMKTGRPDTVITAKQDQYTGNDAPGQFAQNWLIADFYQSILGNTNHIYADFSDGYATTCIIEAALKSMQSRAWTTVLR